MKLNYSLILIPLAQSSPLIGDLGNLFNGSATNAGLLGSLPIVGPLVDGMFGPLIRGIPIVGGILGGNQGQSQEPSEPDYSANSQYGQTQQGLGQQQSNYGNNYSGQQGLGQQPNYGNDYSGQQGLGQQPNYGNDYSGQQAWGQQPNYGNDYSGQQAWGQQQPNYGNNYSGQQQQGVTPGQY